jgi:hypothetical protein
VNEVRLNETLAIALSTEDSTGAATDTTGTPTVVVRRNGSVVSPTVSVTNPAVGVRNITVAIASAQSWAAGDYGQGYVEYVISGLTQRRPFSFIVREAAPSAVVNAAAVRTNLGTELGRIDAAISTRATPDDVADHSAGTGPHAQTYTVLDGDDDPVVGALIRLVSATEAIEATTDNDGEAVLYASADNYTETISKAGYTTTSQALAVSAAAARERTIEQYVIAPSPDVALVPVVVRLRDFEVTTGIEKPVFLEMNATSPVSLGGVFEIDRKKSGTTVNGEYTFYVYPSSVIAAAGYNGTYHLYSTKTTIDCTITVPGADEENRLAGSMIVPR